ncbi:ASCH domain-containing protein [Scytonema sp. NUACC26]|uniref:ASCH domain-containing protein n=1 Tax=Scytonema sp. NUACC26 TaxID=3140176 RepID=UPI0034DBC567
MEQIKQYWQAYLTTLPPDSPVRNEQYVAEQFGDNPDLANSLGKLIVSRKKTATSSALWEWEAEGQPIPKVGQKSIVLDSHNQPLCIIVSTEVTICPYDKVDARFATDEGEGDCSLAYWREAHWRFFSRVLPKIGKSPVLDMPLVCQRFHIVYVNALTHGK